MEQSAGHDEHQACGSAFTAGKNALRSYAIFPLFDTPVTDSNRNSGAQQVDEQQLRSNRKGLDSPQIYEHCLAYHYHLRNWDSDWMWWGCHIQQPSHSNL